MKGERDNCNGYSCSFESFFLLSTHQLRPEGFNPQEGRGNNRSVMPLDVLGCTRVTLKETKSIYILCLTERSG